MLYALFTRISLVTLLMMLFVADNSDMLSTFHAVRSSWNQTYQSIPLYILHLASVLE